MPLKQLIQPFFSPLYQDRVIASKTKQPAATSRLRWGSAGALPAAQMQSPATGINFKVVSNKAWQQWGQPVTEPVTITNPSDSSQSVTVDRIKSIQFTAPDQLSPPGSQTGTNAAFVPSPSVPTPFVPAVVPSPAEQGATVYAYFSPQQPGTDIQSFDLNFPDDGT